MAEVVVPSLGDPPSPNTQPGVHSSAKLTAAPISLTDTASSASNNHSTTDTERPNLLATESAISLPNGCVCHGSKDKLSKPISVSDTLKENQSECRSFDSGLGSDSLSDSKSNSSSPGISAACSNQDFNQDKCPDVSDSVTVSVNNDAVSKSLTVCDTSVSHIADRLSDTNISEEEESKDIENGIEYVVYKSELQMPDIMKLITKDLSEPYSIYTYRYFIHNWPKLCFLAMDGKHCVGSIVCKLDMHKKMVRRGYIAMLAIDQSHRRRHIGSHLVLKAIKAMTADDCDEVVLETEITNKGALHLYENLGFVRDKRLFRYYLNGVDALRLKLWLR